MRSAISRPAPPAYAAVRAGLHHRGAVEVQPERGQVGAPAARPRRAAPGGVEVLDPEQEPPAGGAGEQPGQHRRAEVAQVQVAGRAGRVAARTEVDRSTLLRPW